jgi:hypothetical protein
MIRLLKLVTGDDIVSNVERKGDVYVLNHPHRLVMTREGLGSMPLCPFAKTTEYHIEARNVLFEAEPEDEIRNSYASATGSIVVASSGLVTP